MSAWEKFKSFVAENALFEAGDRVLVAVSGGPDSVCLMHLLWRFKKTVPVELAVVNFDHGLRRESKREARKVLKLGQSFGIPVFLKKIEVREHSNSRKVSLETAGRSLRYDGLVSLASSGGFNKIATGHNANDNAETVLMWLMRGTGTDGLSGIPVTRRMAKKITVTRPLLVLTRREIREYLKSQGLSYSVDASNSKLDFARNRIRARLIPAMEAHNPRFVEHVFNLSRIVSAENGFFDLLVGRILKKRSRRFANGIRLDLTGFFGYNKAVQLRLLKAILPEKRSIFHIERIHSWIYAGGKKEIILSQNWKIIRKRKALLFSGKG
ncbi:MAG: tRNA lysidine(34) synthetase TilS [Endomicrobiales bacterium]|nr:tRNA lysidine(34) synthetase TilS [Endomicrobiales bacterium]